MRTSYKKNRPFDFKLIDLVEPNELIYKRQSGLSNFETMKAKNEIWDKIAAQMGRDVNFCLMRWNNLRYQFQKELRRSTALCPKLGIIRGSTWPYLERLRFLQDLQPSQPKTKKRRTEKATENLSDEKIIWQEFSDHTESEMELDVDNTKATTSQQQQQQLQPQIYANSEEPQEIDPANCTPQMLEDADYAIFEEIIEDDEDDEMVKDGFPYEQDAVNINSSISSRELSDLNMQRMDALLNSIQDTQRARVERRIMAFALKCQLRTLMNQSTDDLII